MTRILSALIVALVVTIGGAVAPNTAAAQAAGTSAASAAALSDADPWRLNVALYARAINVSGNVTVRNTSTCHVGFRCIVRTACRPDRER